MVRKEFQVWRLARLLTAFVIVSGCPAIGSSFQQGSEETDPEEYVIYAALYKQKGGDTAEQELVIHENTRIEDYFAEPNAQNRGEIITQLIKDLPPLMKETAEDFFDRNTKPAKLTDHFNLKAKVVLISDTESKRMFQTSLEDAWNAFRKKYPHAGGIDTLSRVGFNKDRTQALLYYAYVCGGLCGQGQYVLFVKKEGEWKIEKERPTWIS